MKQKKDKLPSKLFLGKPFGWSSLIILSILCLEGEKARADTTQVPGLAIARFALPSISASTENINPTGTPVGLKVGAFKTNLEMIEGTSASLIQSTRDLYENVIVDVSQYYSAIGEIEAKLQLGTTPSNPKLMGLRNQALQQLDKLVKTIGMMSGYATNFSSILQQIKTLLSYTQAAFYLPGAVDEDHAHLLFIVGELERLERIIGQMSIVITTNIQRQNEWLSAERIRFANLEKSIERGQFEPSSHGLSFPKPAPLPKLHSHKKGHPAHKHAVPIILANTTPENEKKTEAKPLPLTSSPQPLQKKEKETKANSLSPLSISPGTQTPKPPTPQTQAAELRKISEEILPKVDVVSHPQIQLVEEIQPSPSEKTQATKENAIQYSGVIKGRTPLGVLEANQDAMGQKWYLYSAAKRGIKAPTDRVEIISIGDHGKGEEVKALLIKMGIKPEQLNLIKAQGEADHTGKVYIYSKS